MPPTPAQAPSSCGLSCSPVPAVVPALTSSVLSRPSSPNQHQTSAKPAPNHADFSQGQLSAGAAAGAQLRIRQRPHRKHAEKQVEDGTTQPHWLLEFRELTTEHRTAQSGDLFCTIQSRTSILWRGAGHTHELWKDGWPTISEGMKYSSLYHYDKGCLRPGWLKEGTNIIHSST